MSELTVEDVKQAKDLGKDITIENWPFGRKQRCSMHFFVEVGKKGERLVRQSTMDGRTYKPKKSTYTTSVKIVELNSKTCHIEWDKNYGMLTVCKHDGVHLHTFFDTDARLLALHFGLI